MGKPEFNLITDPWIKVLRADNYKTEEVSLTDLLKNASAYRQFAGETKSQDFAVMRIVLAILQTVYSRFDAEGEPYEWLSLNDDNFQISGDVYEEDYDSDALLATWKQLNKRGSFSPIVGEYLQKNLSRFNFFGDHPFFQVTSAEYDALVPAKKRVSTGSGTVAVRQINRQVSESGNSPAIFAPKTADTKDKLELAEFVRWIIAYQSFTGVTDKSKIVTDEKFSNGAGWIYRIDPVFINGQNVFETLLMNLVLVNDDGDEYQAQHPVWESTSVLDYVQNRKRLLVPTNLAELYTYWSRILCIQWPDDGVPQIFSAGIPMFDSTAAFVEPMTTWRWNKKDAVFRPKTKHLDNLSTAMWRNFGQYVDVHREGTGYYHQPGIVSWVQELKNEGAIAMEKPVTLATANLISDGNATSQAPAAEMAEQMTVTADVLFDVVGQQYWPKRIDDTIEQTNRIAYFYRQFVNGVSSIHNDVKDSFANVEVAKLYQQLNGPFYDWLAGLSINDDRDQKIQLWQKQLGGLVLADAATLMGKVSSQDMGRQIEVKGNTYSIFDVYRQLRINVFREFKRG